MRENRLALDPSLVVRTVPELFDLARTLSVQAVELYRGLGARMSELGNQSAREAFAVIEAEQRRHARALEDRMPPELRSSPTSVRRWIGPAVYDDEELASTRLVTPYRALSMAARNEQRAFAFWTYISAHAHDPEVQAEAETLARDELNHLRLVRTARRRAYHEAARRDARRGNRLRSMSLAEFRGEAAGRETALAALHARVAGVLAVAGHPQAGLLAEIAEAESESAAALGGEDGTSADALEPLPEDSESALNLALEMLEESAEFYIEAAETLQTEAAVAEAQRLSETAVRRLASLHGRSSATSDRSVVLG